MEANITIDNEELERVVNEKAARAARKIVDEKLREYIQKYLDSYEYHQAIDKAVDKRILYRLEMRASWRWEEIIKRSRESFTEHDLEMMEIGFSLAHFIGEEHSEEIKEKIMRLAGIQMVKDIRYSADRYQKLANAIREAYKKEAGTC